MSITPAAARTYIVEIVDGAIIRTPVIGWASAAEGPNPVTLDGESRLLDAAILFPCGMVHSRSIGLCFESVAEWKVMAEKNRGAIPTVADSPPAYEDEPLGIEWLTTPFKRNSYYQYEHNGTRFIFNVPDGLNPPKQTGPVTRITRDEFETLKNDVQVAEYADLIEGGAEVEEELI